MATTGADVGPPAPCFWRVAGIGHAEEGRELRAGVGRGDADVRQHGPVEVRRSRHARLLLQEEAHRLAEVGAGAATEADDRVDPVPPTLQHGLLHERHRHVRLDLTEGRLEVPTQELHDPFAVG
jgi:hypothetical protein